MCAVTFCVLSVLDVCNIKLCLVSQVTPYGPASLLHGAVACCVCALPLCERTVRRTVCCMLGAVSLNSHKQ